MTSITKLGRFCRLKYLKPFRRYDVYRLFFPISIWDTIRPEHQCLETPWDIRQMITFFFNLMKRYTYKRKYCTCTWQMWIEGIYLRFAFFESKERVFTRLFTRTFLNLLPSCLSDTVLEPIRNFFHRHRLPRMRQVCWLATAQINTNHKKKHILSRLRNPKEARTTSNTGSRLTPPSSAL